MEIPSVESPEVLDAVLGAAREYGVTVNRVSQGSGSGLLRESELREMAADRRVRDAQLAGGGAHAAMEIDAGEGAQRLEREGAHGLKNRPKVARFAPLLGGTMTA